MWSFIVYLNDHLGSCAEYIAKVGQEQEVKDIPYASDLRVEQQCDRRVAEGGKNKEGKEGEFRLIVNRES
jgi:hypothetical protein